MRRDIGVGEHRAFRVSGGAGGVHDQRRSVTRDVDGRSRIAVLGDEILVAHNHLVRRRLGHDHRRQHRRGGTHRGGDRRQHRFGDEHAGAAVVDQIRQLRRSEPEIDRNGDRAQPIRRQGGLDEFRAIEHQDHHPIAETDTAAMQRTGQRGHPAIELRPGDAASDKPQCGGVGLHQCVAIELGDPVLPAGQVGLLGIR